MAGKDELITAADFVSLKKLVSNEISRRSASGSVGSMSNYNGSNYQYSVIPASGKKITYEHIQKITAPLDAINEGALTPSQNSKIEAELFVDATNLVGRLSKIPASSSSSGCAASCSGLCTTGCYNACTGCTGSCETGCFGSCKNGCNGCDGCSGSCGTSCANNCSNACTGSCSGSCSGGCFRNCDGCGTFW